MIRIQKLILLTLAFGLAISVGASAQAQDKKPNILFIMGDDIGMWNIGAYHRGLMAGRTPNLDKLAKEGMLFTDYYAEASCTAGRANFIIGELPIRTGMTTVGQAVPRSASQPRLARSPPHSKRRATPPVSSAKIISAISMSSCPLSTASTSSSATSITSTRWKTRRIPTTRRICWTRSARATWFIAGPPITDDPTVMPRWGKIGKQKIEDAGTLYPERMKTVDDEIRDLAFKFIDKAKTDNKPFFCWLNPTRMHIVTHLSDKYEKMRNSENGWSEEEAGMAQLDDDVGLVMQKLKDIGVDDNTIVVFTTDNGTELFTWPDGGTTPFAQCKGTVMEGGFRVPCILRWPGHVPADSVQNGIFSGLDWFPTFLAAAGNPNITDQLLKGVKLGDRTYKNHLDGYDQMAAITGKGPSARHEIFYLGESTVGAVRIDDYKYRFIDQPNGWLGAKTQWTFPT